MKYLDTKSLFRTVDNVSEALLFGFDVDVNEKKQIADFIIGRQNSMAYANTFAPTENDSKQDLILFTGERIKSRAGRYHIIGEETSRILRKLGLKDDKITNALQKADVGLKNLIDQGIGHPRYVYGTYCCKNCSCALWINLSAGAFDENAQMLDSGLCYLKMFRDTNGSWKGFPGYYTLYVLHEIDFKLAKAELQYAAVSIERKFKRLKNDKTKYDSRRRYICEQILDKLNS